MQPPPIDKEDDISQQTLQALRLLMRSGLISKETKDYLTLDMIECMTEGQPSMTEKAFKMLVYNRLDGPTKALTDGVVDDVLEEFGEQCSLIADILVTQREEDDEDGEQSEDEEEEEGDDDEALIAALAGSLKASGDVEEDEDDDDEEAVIAALTGSLSPQ